MNRVITGRLGIFSFLVVLFAAGCAVEQASEGADQQQATEDSDMISADAPPGARGMPSVPVVVHLKGGESGACLGCGPLPEPWQMGPLPEPWTSSSSSSGSSGVSSSSSSSGASGGGGTSSGNGKP